MLDMSIWLVIKTTPAALQIVSYESQLDKVQIVVSMDTHSLIW